MEVYYKWQNGQKVKMTSREVKAYVMKVNNWTSEQYVKQRDILKNKLSAYESYQQSRGVNVEKQSATSLLFKEAKAKKTYGADYKPSMKMQQIKSFSAYSITKGRQMAQSNERYQQRQKTKYNDYVQQRFGGLIASNPTAQKIDEMIDDPVKKEQALTDFANKLGAKISEDEKVEANEAIPVSSETYGSGEEIDFDIEDYLE